MPSNNLSSPAAVSAVLARHGLHPRKKFGQNFLVDANVLAKIVASGEVAPGAQVLEVGGGLGVLTQALARAATETGKVVTVEIDTEILPALHEAVADFPQVAVVHADFLALNQPEFLAERFGAAAAGVHVVANIPYNITTPLVAALLEVKPWLANIVLLVQKEVAERLAARAGSDDYGALLSVFAQYHCEVSIAGIVSRRVFFPNPSVDSAIVRMIPRREPVALVSDEAAFFRVVRGAFGQRRKSLSNALSGDPALNWTREQALHALNGAGIDPQRRGETLSIAEFAAIAEVGTG